MGDYSPTLSIFLPYLANFVAIMMGLYPYRPIVPSMN